MAERIYLIRHGETDSNAARIVQTPETPLSERGREQARRVGERLAAVGIDAILSSDLERAHETARAIAAATGKEIELDASLQERNFGDLRGTPYTELREDIFAHDFTPPGGENGTVFDARVAQAWERVLQQAEATDGILAVVSHGLVLRGLAEHCLDTGGHEPDSDWANTCVTIVTPTPPYPVERLACTEHLEGTSGAPGGIA